MCTFYLKCVSYTACSNDYHFPAEVLDYRGISTVITFSSSVSGNCLTLVVIDDNGTEKNETLLMSLFFLQDTHNVNFTQESVTVEIIDDDGEIVCSVEEWIQAV